MAFSAALALTDLNDFLGPSQECIKPVNVVVEEEEASTASKAKEAGAAAVRERTSLVSDRPRSPSPVDSSSLTQILAARSRLEESDP